MSAPYRIFYDAKGNPVAKISESTLQCRFTDIEHLERFYRDELVDKPVDLLPGIRQLIKDAAKMQEVEYMDVEDENETMTSKKSENELISEKKAELMRSRKFNA